ncbi:hypothetical protein GXN76_02065 [Kroppenstedtia pulmonis]|uniref:Uncharacterized protein n=1 Tax=Kroppenstedtia pulmonis TaxID=1380685 RepID=A0A7D4BUT5_9BACL|nr:hypothetical protein [Kroppenstedtia pulmonis]QKG83373.1 hypothetical protein GXN76_02065 [Kroppenstedtia pulmonis]
MNLDRFHLSHWKDLSFEERLKALQDLEHHYAKEQGREPRNVESEKIPGLNYMGYYDPSQDIIKINEDHIKQDDFHYCCVETVIHEGRHAYQEDAIVGIVSHPDAGEVQKWKENAIAYKDKPYFMYRLQPLERDANDYANGQTYNLFQELEQRHGKNKGFKKYVKKYHIKDKEYAIEDAQDRFGEQYIQRIDEEIHKEYVKLVENEQVHYKINGIEFNPDRSVKESVKGRTSIPDAHRNAQVLLNEAKEERHQAQSLVLMKNMERDGGKER